jgi:hypothetical protein
VRDIIAESDKLAGMDDGWYDYLTRLNHMTLSGILPFSSGTRGATTVGSTLLPGSGCHNSSSNKRCIIDGVEVRPCKQQRSLYQFTDFSSLNRIF